MKKVVTFGEVMLRLATPGFQRFIQSTSLNATFGGGEANVAISLANFGIPVDYVTRLPNNDIAACCISKLRKYNMGNEEDAEKVFGIKPEGFDAHHTAEAINAADFESVCVQLKQRFSKAQKVIITMRGFINANHNTWVGDSAEVMVSG